MKVYCRFAPSAPAGSGTEPNTNIPSANTPLLLHVSTVVHTGSRGAGTATLSKSPSFQERVSLTDPLTGSHATFACDAAFVPATLLSTSRAEIMRGRHQEGLDAAAGAAAHLESSLPLDASPDRGTDRVSQTDVERGFVSEQDRVYERICKDFARQAASPSPTPSAVPRNVLLAYGQTSSGKTHTLFGSFVSQQRAERQCTGAAASGWGGGASPAWWEAQLQSPAAGLVPRFLADLFPHRSTSAAVTRGHGTTSPQLEAAVRVDISCCEVYNEATTDLVAVVAGAAEERESWPRARTRGPARSANSEKHLFHGDSHGRTASAANAAVRVGQAYPYESGSDSEDEITVEEVTGSFWGETPSVAAARQLYLQEEGATPSTGLRATQTTFKATEKGLVLGRLQRARCRSAVEGWVLVNQLLAQRQRSETERNASSSRGHLLLRFEVRQLPGEDSGSNHRTHPERETSTCGRVAACPSGKPISSVLLSETLFCDLAGSESHRVFSTAPAHPAGGGAQRLRRPRSRSLNTSLDSSAMFLGAGTCSEYTDEDSVCSSTAASSTSQWERRSHGSRGSHAAARSFSSASLCFDKNEAQMAAEAEAKVATRGREMRNINASLLALRKVIHAFYLLSHTRGASRADGAESKGRRGRPSAVGVHAPFKDSALTTILEPFLLPHMAGATPTAGTLALVVCCSSRQADFHETVSSLRLGAEASAVKPRIVLQCMPHLAAQQPIEEQQQQQQQQHQNRRVQSYARPHSAPLPLRRPSPLPQPVRQGQSHEDTKRHSEKIPNGYLDDNKKNAATQTEAFGTSSAVSVPVPKEEVLTLRAALADMSEEVHALRQERKEQDRARHELTLQFATLCAHYKECVEALSAAEAREREKDAQVQALQSLLHARQSCSPPMSSQQKHDASQVVTAHDEGTRNMIHGDRDHGDETPWTAGKPVEVSPCSAALNESVLDSTDLSASASANAAAAATAVAATDTHEGPKLTTVLFPTEHRRSPSHPGDFHDTTDVRRPSLQRSTRSALPPPPPEPSPPSVTTSPRVLAERTNLPHPTTKNTMQMPLAPLRSTLLQQPAPRVATAEAEEKEKENAVPTAAPCRVYKI